MMRLKTKLSLIAMLAGLPVALVVGSLSSSPESAMAAFGVWLVVCFLLRVVFLGQLFLCCRMPATIRSDGSGTLSVGTECRYCHRELLVARRLTRA